MKAILPVIGFNKNNLNRCKILIQLLEGAGNGRVAFFSRRIFDLLAFDVLPIHNRPQNLSFYGREFGDFPSLSFPGNPLDSKRFFEYHRDSLESNLRGLC